MKPTRRPPFHLPNPIPDGRIPGAPPRRPATRLAAAALLCLFFLLLTSATATAVGAPEGGAGWPLRPRPEVVRGFELPAKPWMPGHRGLDLAGSPGQPVLSATAGTITYAGQLAGRGVIVVSLDTIRTTYEPVIASVQVGAIVQPGEQIGRLSAAGSHCSPAACLHWGLREGDTYLDPLSLLPSQPVRLLPLDEKQATAKDSHRATGRTALPRTAPPKPEDGKSAADVGSATAGEGAAVGRLTDDHAGGATAGIVVGLAAVVTVGSALMIRRH